MILIRTLLGVAFMLLLNSTGLFSQSPTWEVNPENYSYSLSYTGSSWIDGNAVGDSSDVVAAFINNECRGVASPVYIDQANKWVFFLSIYSNSSNDTVRFKYYSISEDSVYSLHSNVLFISNYVYGSIMEPMVTSNIPVDKAELISYDIPGQLKSEIIEDTVFVIFEDISSTNELAATFEISPGAIAKIGDVVQSSGNSLNNFKEDIEMTIISGDRSIEKTYYIKTRYLEQQFILSAWVNNEFISSENDTVFAYINDKLIAKSRAEYLEDIEEWRYILSIIRHSNNSSIEFKIYRHSIGDTVNLINDLHFVDGLSKGTYYRPLILSDKSLTGTSFLSFYISGQIGETEITADQIKITVPDSILLSNITPMFECSPGAMVEYNDSVQYSGFTSNDFSEPLVFRVSNQNGGVHQEYTISIEKEVVNSISTNTVNEVFSATNIISPNGDGINDFWIVHNVENYVESNFSIYNLLGRKVFQSTGYRNNWNGNHSGNPLPGSIYIYVVEHENGIMHSGKILVVN